MNSHHVLLACALAAFARFPARAQTAPAADNATAPSSEVLTLSEFEVSDTTQKDQYIASEAVSATRSDAKTIDLPFNVQIVTNDFMEDFQVFDENNYKPMMYVPGYAPDNGGYLMGFPAVVLRDGFYFYGPPEIANTQQIEVIMGPESTMYGYTGPGGVVNYITKRPSANPEYDLTFSKGAYNFNRYQFQATGPVVKDKLFYLLNVSQIYNSENMQYYYSNVNIYSLALTYKVSDATSIEFSWETQDQQQNGGSAIPNLLVGSKESGTNPLVRTGGINDGPYLPLAGFNQIGPDQRINRTYDSAQVLFNHRFGENWSARLTIQGTRRTFEDHRWTTGISYYAETNTLSSRQPAFQTQQIDTDEAMTDIAGHFSTGPIKHSLLIGADYTRERYQNNQFLLPSALDATIPSSEEYLNASNPNWTPWTNYSLLTSQDSKDTYDTKFEGVTASDRMYLLNDRLIVMASGRENVVQSNVDNHLSATGDGDGTVDLFTYSTGANYKILGDNLLVYAKYSTSFDRDNTVDAGTDTVRAPDVGRGPEAGFKGVFDDERFGYTVSLFRISQDNIPFANPDYTSALAGTGVPEYLGSGQDVLNGWSTSVTARATDNLTFLGNFAILDSHITAASGTPQAVGQPLQYVPDKTVAGAARYDIHSGLLKGLRFGAGLTYTGRRVTNYGSATALFYTVPAVQLVTALASYAWRTGKFTHTVNFNVQNLFDKYYINAAYKLGDGRNMRVTYKLSY